LERAMNYTEALSFSFQDEEWPKKLLIGGLFAFISLFAGLIFILGFFSMGYYVGLLRNVMQGNEKPLPRWDNWSKIIVDGLLGGIICLVYLVVIGGVAAIMIISVVEEPGMQDFEMVMAIIVISLLALFSLSILCNLGLARFAATNDFGAAFGLVEIFRLLKNDFGNYVTISIFSFILNAVLFLAGLGVFSPFTNFWGMVVQAHLFGQCVRRAGEEPAAVEPEELSGGLPRVS
jgi:hypothetical protein